MARRWEIRVGSRLHRWLRPSRTRAPRDVPPVLARRVEPPRAVAALRGCAAIRRMPLGLAQRWNREPTPGRLVPMVRPPSDDDGMLVYPKLPVPKGRPSD